MRRPAGNLHGVGLGGPTTLANLALVCPRHHDQITYTGAELTGGHPDWHWRPPPGRQPVFDDSGDPP